MSLQHVPTLARLLFPVVALCIAIKAIVRVCYRKTGLGMLTCVTAALVAAPATAHTPLDAVPQTRLDAQLRCLLGVYALPEHTLVTNNTGVDGQPRA